MNGWAMLAAAAGSYAAWDTRRRWAPPEVLQLVGDAGETDQAPDLIETFDAYTTSDDMSTPTDTADRNVRAFLDALTLGEGTSGPDGYRTLVGGRLFASFADHPAELGWSGLRLSDGMCRAAGFGPGCVSTAAGRYQIIRPTWRRLRARLQLSDFSPAAQDAAAIELIRERGALPLVQAGRIAEAVSRVRTVWASLPGAGYGQREERIGAVLAAYTNAGGALA